MVVLRVAQYDFLVQKENEKKGLTPGRAIGAPPTPAHSGQIEVTILSVAPYGWADLRIDTVTGLAPIGTAIEMVPCGIDLSPLTWHAKVTEQDVVTVQFTNTSNRKSNAVCCFVQLRPRAGCNPFPEITFPDFNEMFCREGD